MDRCREDTILDTLEAMKLFMFTGKVAFVIGADERHISYVVKSKFKDIEGIQIDIGKEYLEKLVQYPIHMPDGIVEQMKAKQGVTEQLKAKNQMLWVWKMNNIIACAEKYCGEGVGVCVIWGSREAALFCYIIYR